MNIQQQIVDKMIWRNKMSAKNFSIEPNPDFLHRKEVELAIEKNGGYCCCAISKNEDTKCMCKAFREQDHAGFCHCGRYYKVIYTPKVCLCGSTRFKDKFFEVARKFTLDGYIVSMPMVFGHSGDEISESGKVFLDEVHKAKIADADLIFIVNCDRYIGESTRSEIQWAEELKKKIEYLEPQI